jgi:hypothetical protein
MVCSGRLHLFQPWTIVESIEMPLRWPVDDLITEALALLMSPSKLNNPFG